MDLESVVDELYGGSPDDFVERRKALASVARKAGDRALAKAVTELRRPTRSAWMVNLLARADPTGIEDLVELGAALGDAQRRAAGHDLRRLSKQRHSSLETLSRCAAELAVEQGYTATEAIRQEVSQTLQAALADPAVADLIRAGRLAQPATYGGFGPMDLFAMMAQSAVGSADEADQQSTEGEPTVVEPPKDPARVAAETAVRKAVDVLDEARAEATRAEQEADKATSHADEFAEQVEALRAQLDEAERAERDARGAARAARKHHQERQQVTAAAEQQLGEARSALDAVDQS